MVRRRSVVVSDDDDDESGRRLGTSEEGEEERRKAILLSDEEGEEETTSTEGNTEGKEKGEDGKLIRRTRKGRWGEVEKENKEGEENEEEEEDPLEDAIPIGDVIRVSGTGRGRKYHFRSFEYDGNVFELEDFVLVTPEHLLMKPYVAIIKDITQNLDNSMFIMAQWFYRPEEAEKKGGGHWKPCDGRELFYSFHLDQVPAESVMHKCVAHFIPSHKKLPVQYEHPGFIVQRVYDTVHKMLWKLTGTDYGGSKQHTIDILFQKTRDRIGELPDAEFEECTPDQDDAYKQRPKKKQVQPIDLPRTDEKLMKHDHLKEETHGSQRSDATDCTSILAKYKALTGDSCRDRWLDKLLQGTKPACYEREDTKSEESKLEGAGTLLKMHVNKESEASASTKASGSNRRENICWPDTAVQAVTGLEKAAHEALGSDFQKYNQKMRQLTFNLKNNNILARRLLNKELDPTVILSMSPIELKDGLTADERVDKEPEEFTKLQMIDARCSRCNQKTVGIAEIIQTGSRGNRYQLECLSCGYNGYASEDAILSLHIETPNAAGNVDTAP